MEEQDDDQKVLAAILAGPAAALHPSDVERVTHLPRGRVMASLYRLQRAGEVTARTISERRGDTTLFMDAKPLTRQRD